MIAGPNGIFICEDCIDVCNKVILEDLMLGEQEEMERQTKKAKPEEKLLEEYKTIAVRRVKLGLLLSEIGKSAKINITPDDINKAIMNEARKYPGQEKAVFDFYLKNKQAVEALKAPVFEEKIVDYIFEQATITEKTVTVEELYNFSEEGAKSSNKKSSTCFCRAKALGKEKSLTFKSFLKQTIYILSLF
jgi:trigger factor